MKVAKKNPRKPSQMSIMAILRRKTAAREKGNPWALLKVVGGRIANEILMYFRSRKKHAQDLYIQEPMDVDGEGNALTLMDLLAQEGDLLEDVDRRIKGEQLHRFVQELEDPREKTVILLRYGLNGTPPMAQREVAKELGISRSYVSRIEKKAVENLRRRFGQEAEE